MRNFMALVNIITICFLTSCSRLPNRTQPNIPVSCNDIDERDLSGLLLDSATNEEIQQVLSSSLDTPNIEIAEIVFTENPSYSKVVQWEVDNKGYHLYLRGESAIRIQSNIEMVGADIESILRCFGEPDYYYATYQQDVESRVMVFSLWYLDEGIVASTSMQSRSETPPDLVTTMIVRTVDYVEASDLETMIADVVLYGTDAQIRQSWLNRMRPWPETWEDLIVDNQVR